MKIQFPNPEDYQGNEDMFFEQLELCVYHAKKSWLKIRGQKRYQQDTENNYPWIKFSFSDKIVDAITRYKDNSGKLVDPDGESLQEISISIYEL